MREAARIQSAIEVLERVLHGGEAADRALQSWGRANRFAGSGDRRAIAELVYSALRTGNAGTARAVMLAGLAAQGLGLDRIAALFNGERHAPAPLDEAERVMLTTPVSLPEWLDMSLRRAFGDRLDDELAALARRAPLDLRVNSLKATRSEAIEALAEDGIVVEPLDRPPTALRVIAGSVDVDTSRAYTAGLVEIQDAGSQIICGLAQAEPGMAVLDLCAGAGGKSLALAAAMANEGRVLATDIASVRLKRLKPRAQRAGATIIETRLLEPDWLEQPDPFGGERFDLVVVDAPCSGSGTWRRNPETRLRLTPERLADLAALQRRLLGAAQALVRPGGRLAYITCSVLPEEGEDVVQAFLGAHPHLSHAGPPMRLSPASSETDGFFAAVFDNS